MSQQQGYRKRQRSVSDQNGVAFWCCFRPNPVYVENRRLRLATDTSDQEGAHSHLTQLMSGCLLLGVARAEDAPIVVLEANANHGTGASVEQIANERLQQEVNRILKEKRSEKTRANYINLIVRFVLWALECTLPVIIVSALRNAIAPATDIRNRDSIKKVCGLCAVHV